MSSIREFSKREKPEDYYLRLVEELKKLNNSLNAFSVINEGLSSGMPFSVKDNICVEGIETTASSKVLKGYIPPFSATAVERMLASGFGFLGKTNMDEFGFGTFGLNSEKEARNPFDEKYVAGGSSSGAAIATSILRYHIAIAESTGGSIAAPAAFCGVVGFTPTYGVVSRYGLIDYANSLDKIGIVARSAEDIEETLEIIKGRDRYDTTCTGRALGREPRKRIFIIKELMEGVDESIKSHFTGFAERLKGMGYAVEERSVSGMEKAIAAYYVIAMAEASTNLAKYTGYKYGLKNEKYSEHYNEFFTNAREHFGIEAKRRIILGTFIRSASVRDRYYYKALRLRAELLARMEPLLEEGFVLAPVMPIKVPKIDEAKGLSPLEMYKADMLTIPPNLAGLPHVSFPYAYIGGMPLGAQLMTSHFNDYSILGVVKEWERVFTYRFRYNIGSL